MYRTDAFDSLFFQQTKRRAGEAEKKSPGDFEILREFFAGSKYKISFQETGNTQDSVWSCGQVIGLIKDIPTVQMLMDGIVQEAITTIQHRLSTMIVPGAKL